ncbi:MAG: CBS domain-containing protein [Ardenticatenaceae bacterium]|nr:CBS domain-containing protein [Ardenticatenaceae bacterium]HBY93429.1 acetoin utilization protein AcuB [Chloroflexota bacterium]
MTTPQLVRDIMSTDLVTVTPDESLAEALLRMRRHDVRRLPVVDETGLVGIITDRDLRLAADSPFLDETPSEAFHQLEQHRVEDIMTTSVTTIEPEAPIVEAAKLIRVAHVGGLPVVDENDRLVGIVTRTDLVDHLIRLLEPVENAEV